MRPKCFVGQRGPLEIKTLRTTDLCFIKLQKGQINTLMINNSFIKAVHIGGKLK